MLLAEFKRESSPSVLRNALLQAARTLNPKQEFGFGRTADAVWEMLPEYLLRMGTKPKPELLKPHSRPHGESRVQASTFVLCCLLVAG
jgi:hypothetical protein